MKLKSLLTSVIFLCGALAAQAQISQLYYQGFESGEQQRYSSLPATAIATSTDFYKSGSQSLCINQQTTSDVTFLLDTIDLSGDLSLQYITLQFDHICNVYNNGPGDYNMGRIYYRFAHQTESDWRQLTGANYNTTESEEASYFGQLACFSRDSYFSWDIGPINNDSWRSERMDLNNVLNASMPAAQRKLLIKFVLRQKTTAITAAAPIGKWRIDNIKVTASSSLMVSPRITMVEYPDGLLHPSSRGARIMLNASTTVPEGIEADSVIVTYRVSNRPGEHRITMAPVAGVAGRYSAMIPFEGYDTVMYFNCRISDATSNANSVTFPKAENSWIEYRCVRGTETPVPTGLLYGGSSASVNTFPFSHDGASRSEWILDSALMADNGYGPGAITDLSFVMQSVTATSPMQRFQLKMANAPTSHTCDTNNPPFSFNTSYMRVVYDSALTIPLANANTPLPIHFQDTFFYAGKDLVIQTTGLSTFNSYSASVRVLPVIAHKASIYYSQSSADGYDPFTGGGGDDFSSTYNASNRRPAARLTAHANLPLIYDLGISELVDPSFTTAMVNRPGSITVKLKNFGVNTANAIRISYSIDDTIPGFYDWTGTLAGGAETNVTIASNSISIPAGYHTLRVWVEDTLTSGSARFRDHEPLNDTAFSQFIVCDGPLSGVRHIGGSTPDYNDIEEFLFSLSRCGVDDSLIVKLAPGYYPPFTMPTVNGISALNYIVFEPASADSVVFYSDGTSNASCIVNLESVSHVRFRNINFVRTGGALTDMVTLGFTSVHCRFEGCHFEDRMPNPPASMRISAMINTGFTYNLTVDRCTFVGGKIGVDMKGQASDITSFDNTVRRSVFRNQYERAISVQNQTNAVVDSNEMYDVLSNSSYVLMIYEAHGASRFTNNKVYSSHGGGGIGVSSAVGTASTHVLVANNMVVVNDDGVSNMMLSPLNIIQATWTDVVYNSVKMTAPTRTNTAAAIFGGGQTLDNNRFVNNVIVALDNVNYAFNYIAGNGTNNTVGHNVYYSRGSILNRMSGTAYTSMTDWTTALPSDNASVSVNPNFLNGSLVDLRTYNRLVKGVGIPLTQVTTDIFGTARSTTATCPGAFEFVALNYDFEPEGLTSPELVTCFMPDQVELAVLMRNSGVNAYNGSTGGLTIHYQVNGGTAHQVAVSQNIPAEDTVTVRTGAMLQLPPNGTVDSTYSLKVWVSFTGDDPNQTNDTNQFSILSKYHPVTPGSYIDSIDYATATTLTPTQGISSWAVYNATSAPKRNSQIYWYADTTEAPFHVGPSYRTDTLRLDTTFYISQRREQAIVRFTQLEIAHAATTAGVSPNQPYWLLSGRRLAVQLTNVGDATAYLEGDTLMTVSPTTSINNKVFVFGDVSIAPGESLVVQMGSGNNTSNLPLTVSTNNINFQVNNANNANVAFVLKRGGAVEDVVALNTAPTATYPANQAVNWTSMNIPSYVWQGNGVTMAFNAGAGIVRSAFNGRATDWYVATSSNPMFLDATNPDWIRYVDNGCESGFGKVKVALRNPPAADLAVEVPVLPQPGCGLADEVVSVEVYNYGIAPVSSFVLNYCAGGDTVSEVCTDGVAANGSVTYTFTHPLNMHFASDSVVTVKVWVDALADDHARANDTNSASTLSLLTPDAPVSLGTRQVSYATRDTISLSGSVLGPIPVWYDYDMNAVDTGYTHVTDILYTGGTMGMAYIGSKESVLQVGTGTAKVTKNTYPNPYQPAAQYAKQQYLYTAEELRTAGLKSGPITAMAFYLDSIYGTADTVWFDEYKVSIGTTTDNVFLSNAGWKSAPLVVYERNPFPLARRDSHGWLTHELDTLFVWDGVSSIVVQVVHHINTIYNTGVQVLATSKANTALYKSSTTALTPPIEEFTGNGNRNNNRPNIRFTNVSYEGCIGPVTPYTVQIVNAPAVDMAVSWPAGVDTVVYNSCDSISLYVNLKNQGSSSVNGLKVYYQLDENPVDSTQVATTIGSGQLTPEVFFKDKVSPGRHTITAFVATTGDMVQSNDTVRRPFTVRFCGGTYTIAQDGDADYQTFGEAIDTLNAVGIEGSVSFNVSNGTYQEQVYLGAIPGSSEDNTLAFVGTGDSVLLTAPTTQTANYVLKLDGTSNITLNNLKIESRPTGNINYANAVVMQNGDNINLTGCAVKVKGTINNANASCIVLTGNVTNLTMLDNVLDSGYYSVKTSGNVFGYTSIIIRNNIIKNFWSQGVNIRGAMDVDVSNNEITSGVTVDNRALVGVAVAQSAGMLSIQKNKIYLIDEKKGGKLGILLENINCSNTNPGLLANNMISCYGTNTSGMSSGLKPSGIWIDSSSTNINVFFNSVRVYCGPNANVQYSDGSRSFFAGSTVRNLQVMSNIFSNFSKGYAYYVSELNNVNVSNFNAYYTVSERPFAWKQTQLADLAALQTINEDDGNSMFTEPYFTSESDLHLQVTELVAMAQYTSDVVDDIDGRTRPQIPAPTIGAHEKDVSTHDMAVVRIFEPTMPANVNNPTHIESDSVKVKASFYNNGQSAESNVRWYAYIEGFEDVAVSDTINLGSFQPAEMKIDSLMMPAPLGITREQTVHVVVLCDGDLSLDDNDLTSSFYLAPAFNLAATKMATDRNGCELRDAVVKMTIKNDGAKTLPMGTVLTIGYRAMVSSPANVTISNIGGDSVETYVLDADLLPTRTTTIDFAHTANLYPTDTSVDIQVKIMGWCKYEYDISPENDTAKTNSQMATVNSYYTPAPPHGIDTSFAYGTWGVVRAEQENKLPIRWYRDSTATAFYRQTQYVASTKWSNTPQYFHDSTYYLNCYSTKNCPSYFSPVTVHVNPRVASDMAMEAVLAPLGNRVYMENDTVRVTIANYGTSPQSNVPISFQLKQGNTQIQQVTEVCSATIPPLGTYTYTFNTLLDVQSPVQAKNFTLSVWTNLATDMVRRNDTLRVNHTFRTLAESTYSPQGSSNPGFDVTRVSFNEIDLDLPPMGRGLSNMASYASPDYPVLHVERGMSDSIIVELTKLNVDDLPERCRIWVMIDFDRSGTFSSDEIVVNGDLFYDNETFASYITIPSTASFGYMRMRVAVGSNTDFASAGAPTSGIPSDKNGHTLDFLLFVDAQPAATDLAITQIVTPRSYLVRDGNPKVVTFRLSNKGSNPIANPQITYLFEGDTVDPTATGTVTYPGTLQPGGTGVVTLPAHEFPLGTSTLTLWHSTAGDANLANDTLVYEYHRFHVVTLSMDENFDSLDLWYAPAGRSEFSRNYWERGVPAGTKFTAAHSSPNAWVTDLDAAIKSGKRGNVSYLYSPIINTSQIRSDTMSFYARRDLTNGSSVHLEFLNFENKWEKAVDTSDRTVWYNDADKEVFSGTSGGSNYVHHWVPTSQFSGDFPEMLQFRFVYTAPMVSNANTSFGEGFALDDFSINRARLQEDAGVVDIVYPVDPQYGQTIYPSVVVKNFGTDTIRAIRLGYIYYGSSLSTQSSFTCHIAPDETDTLQFTAPFVITHDFPYEFSISAFPFLAGDIYYENDTCTKTFSLRPLDKDISAEEFVYPLSKVVAGDTAVKVVMRVRNFGAAPINKATLSYMVNGQARVDEQVDFEAELGRPLQAAETFDYTFTQKLWAPMGVMRMVGIVKSEQNDYVYNDTIYKIVEGISNVTDVAVAAVIVDTVDMSMNRIQLIIENRGSRGVNNFEVGFMVDDNPATIHRERYSQERPLSALTTGYHLFSVTLPKRAAGYRNVVGFVHVDGDNDPGNDSSRVQLQQVTDIEVRKIVIEENSSPTCNVYLQVYNRGNMALAGRPLQLEVTVNGTSFSTTYRDGVMPGALLNLQLEGTLEKDRMQNYTGTGRATCSFDVNPDNNETSIIEVQSRVLDIDEVETATLVLGQNYPNPFTGLTTVPFTLPSAARVRIFVMDAKGRMVANFERQCTAGEQEVTLDMSHHATGVYFYGIEVDGERQMRKMVIR